MLDRKSTRLNSSHLVISYAVFCLKKKKKKTYSKSQNTSHLTNSNDLHTAHARLDYVICSTIRCREGISFLLLFVFFFFFNDTATTEIYTLSLHDALPI